MLSPPPSPPPSPRLGVLLLGPCPGPIPAILEGWWVVVVVVVVEMGEVNADVERGCCCGGLVTGPPPPRTGREALEAVGEGRWKSVGGGSRDLDLDLRRLDMAATFLG
jgi:hypothetical protein